MAESRHAKIIIRCRKKWINPNELNDRGVFGKKSARPRFPWGGSGSGRVLRKIRVPRYFPPPKVIVATDWTAVKVAARMFFIAEVSSTLLY
jgi:hypothetical protein